MNYDEEPLYSEEGFSPFTHSDRNHGNNDRNQAHMTMPPPLNRHRNRPPFLRCALIVGLAAVVIALASAGVAVYMTGDCPDQLACVSVEPLACPSPAALAQASEPAKVYEDTHEHNIPACNNSDVCLSKDCVVGAADVLRDIDHNIDPCDDFFEYTCGNYKAANAIPDDRSTVSRFSDLFDANAQVLRSILETPGETAPATELEMTIDLAHKYYQSCMDVDTLEAVSSEGLIAQWRPIIQYDLKQSTLTQTVAELTLSGIRHFFKVEVFSDFKEATRNALYLGQASGLLPDPSYYAMDNHRDAYVSFIVQLFELTGISGTSDMEQNALKAKELFDFEKSLADIQVPPVELRDPIAIYNPMPISDIPASAAFDFAAFFDALNLPAPVDKVIVLVPVYFEKLEAILGAADPKILSM
ncbi:hypothetical protein SARC_06860 [Sphaeroforma arctica JP610]|uniref:Peptidase M13 N-terminal domain-containing protein n=1 Tax=Sphaeroforma arctica JP610 TaxID=667725 RepID=A0A0L0FVD5_9EUKA|nr:hypothetical protein SARC_06860 [Sphaeroforma arctica JP610]KNC80797.1 hypothetical protein SARC_06860 [Sphaeroforma arctica JP610]|eukprot:XP_014154699.1 hypothetical protein SARC_06860 [Sphaeroforma arctica JP610]